MPVVREKTYAISDVSVGYWSVLSVILSDSDVIKLLSFSCVISVFLPSPLKISGSAVCSDLDLGLVLVA